MSCSFHPGAAQENSIQRGRELLLHGDYKEAAVVFGQLLQKNPNDAEAQLGLTRVLIETGDYSSADTKLRDWLKNGGSSELRNALGEILFATGRYSQAADEFAKAARDAKGPALLRATLGQARSLLAQGKRDDSEAILKQFHYSPSSQLSAEELALIARIFVLEEGYKEANERFQDAREVDAKCLDALVGQGKLLTDAYNFREAPGLFVDALKINPNSADAHVGLAEARRYEPGDSSTEEVSKALAVNPNHVAALVMQARMDLEGDKPERAADSIKRALAVNPNSAPALGVAASIAYLRDDKTELDSLTRRALAVNPAAGELFETLAHFAVNNRRYAEAVEFLKRAVELSPRLWTARTELGIELLRVGREGDGKAELERAFTGFPFNPWAKNSLDLLDSMHDYRDTVHGNFLIKCDPKESDALSGYASDLLEEAHKKLTAKYKFTPRSPITVELFNNHEDFAVRSLGLPGLGALGVCFGQVIAMDSPSAREAGHFNWGSALWHEFTHVITLQSSGYRTPRWFSEGLSVYEERRARPGWGDNWSLDKLKAITDGRFVKLADMEAAFTRPKTPDGVPLAYFQASLICDFIDERFGFDAILRILSLYKEGQKTPEVFEHALSMKLDDFDKQFTQYVRAKAGAYIEATSGGPSAARDASKDKLLSIVATKPNDYFARLKLGQVYKTEGDNEKSIEQLRRAIELFPYYAGEGNPYDLLAEIYEAKGRKAEAAAQLEALSRIDETGIDPLKRLARLRIDLGDKTGAVDALRAVFYIYPFDAALHKLAGDVYLDLGDSEAAIKEFNSAAALNPADPAQAHYDLARAFVAAGKTDQARRAVLKALEIAPGFEKAQELLLTLKRGGSPRL